MNHTSETFALTSRFNAARIGNFQNGAAQKSQSPAYNANSANDRYEPDGAPDQLTSDLNRLRNFRAQFAQQQTETAFAPVQPKYSEEERREKAEDYAGEKAEGAVDTAGAKLRDKVLGLDKRQAEQFLNKDLAGKSVAELLGEKAKDFSPTDLKALSDITGKIDPKDAAKLVELVKHLPEDLRGPTLLGLQQAFKALGPDNARTAGKMFSAVDKMLSKLSLPRTGKVVGKVFKGLGKMIPLVGTAFSAKATYDSAKISLDSTLPPEIRFLGDMGVLVNGADTALGVAECFGVGNLGLPANIGLGLASLGLELYTDHQIEQYRNDPDGWKPSRNLDALIGGVGLLMPAALVGRFGLEGAQKKVSRAGTVVAENGIDAAEKVGTAGADATGNSMKLTAAGIDLAAETLRNPEKLGEYAKKLGMSVEEARRGLLGTLATATKAGGELAKKAHQTLDQVGSFLATQGAEGLKTLQWMSRPENRDIMKRAAQLGYDQVILQGGEMATRARNDLRLMGAYGQAVLKNSMNSLLEKGELGLEALQATYNDFKRDPKGEFQDLRDHAIRTASQFAARGGEVGTKALDSLLGFIEAQPEQAGLAIEEVKRLLLRSEAAAQRVASRWKDEVSEGGAALLASLANLGDAGKTALARIAAAGGKMGMMARRRLSQIGTAADVGASVVVPGYSRAKRLLGYLRR